ncbi:glutathione S-transferase family protein [Parasphingorhabdus cellanae]|uniref:Glutathione S-transferase family protein n=1 Tax=Parasphingorhabdus cellanae TaxID=2806553 RepID=A0ABX7T3H7_9SPHN|nr:glutathione S-transferase family protein [Parasphingorhabdus cellanae]QTD56119.1 glutathione S-transferase family protein [Parasphingorhabdus cellanae]
MTEVILHHYENSPFGQAMRLALGLKGINWKSVQQPDICPKPELSALTGGYERIPVLQIGSDIYCDTSVIVDALETLKPEPSLYPEPLGFAGRIIATWSGGLWFMPAVGVALGTNPDIVSDAFWEDRAKRFGMDRQKFLPMVPHLTAQFEAGAALVRDALADGRRYISGDSPGHADLMLYMNMRFVGFAGRKPSEFGPKLTAWYDRIDGIGYGSFEEWTGERAIDYALGTSPSASCTVDEDHGFEHGDAVSVRTESPDPAAVSGILIGLNDRQISIKREDEKVGEVHVHFPRLGQILSPA